MKVLISGQVFIRECECVKRQYWCSNLQEYDKNVILGIFNAFTSLGVRKLHSLYYVQHKNAWRMAFDMHLLHDIGYFVYRPTIKIFFCIL